MAFLFGFILSFFATYAMAQDLTISLEPMVNVPRDRFFFQPYEPPSDVNCDETCPCGFWGPPDASKNTTDKCDCDIETECGGEVPLNLESHSRVIFDWHASSDGKKFVAIKDGKERARFEFSFQYDCGSQPGPYYYAEYRGTDMEYSFEFVTSDGYDDPDGSDQSYQYNSERSFVLFGKCDGCSSCELFTRLQMDPGSDGSLDLNFKSVTFSVSYDNTKVIPGLHNYTWSTDGYNSLKIGEDSKYEVKDLPTGTTTGTVTDSATRWASNVLLLSLLIIMDLLN